MVQSLRLLLNNLFLFDRTSGWNYMSFRFWIGTWITVILIVLTAIDASALVCYITRFTEENFATLIAFIFIYKVWIREPPDTNISVVLSNKRMFLFLPGHRKCYVDWKKVPHYFSITESNVLVRTSCHSNSRPVRLQRHQLVQAEQ